MHTSRTTSCTTQPGPRGWTGVLMASALVASSLALTAAVAAPAAAAPLAASKASAVKPAPTEPSSAVGPRTPLMGFNDWNAFGCDVDEALITATADLFITSGLKDNGYTYVNIDDCWSLKQRDTDGKLVADPEKFPHGLKWLTDYVHSKGLKIGIYSSAGDKTCAGYPGSFGHETTDARSWADWGFDLLKYDNCGVRTTPETQAGFEQRYGAMEAALRGSGRDIVYSLCEWGQFEPWTWAPGMAQTWRTTGDIVDNWASVKSIIAANAQLAQYARPGAFNDPDMLQVGNGGMTDTEYRTHFAMWSMMAAPLLIGTDLREATPATMKILTNSELIAVDQDPLALQGKVIAQSGDTLVLSKPLAGGDRAVALYNGSDTPAPMTVTALQAGLPHSAAYAMTDLWSKATTETASKISAVVPAHGTAVYRVRPEASWSSYAPSTTLGFHADSGYPGADIGTGAGKTVRFSSTLTNYGKVALRDARITATAPEGWDVGPVAEWNRKTVSPNALFPITWELTVPAGTAAGRYTVPVTATYATADRATVRVTRSSVVVQVLPPAPSGENAVSSLDWVSSSNGWGPVERDTSNGETGAGDGKPITIQGTVYAKGLGVHAPSEIVYYLGGSCTSFTSLVGVDDEVNANGEVSFQVFADDKQVAGSGSLTGDDAAATVTADVTGATFLRLVTDTEGANASDHADWANPVLTCS